MKISYKKSANILSIIGSARRCYDAGRNILLFNSNDNHSCVQCDGGTLDYRGLNIPKETMLSLAQEITGQRTLLGFSENVIENDELKCYLHSLHQMIMDGSKEFEKEEMLLFLISLLIEQYGQLFSNCIPECSREIEDACVFMSEHFTEHITLKELCKRSGFSKSTLLRAFTKSKGITPYRYLYIHCLQGKSAAMDIILSRRQEEYLHTGLFLCSHFFSYVILI